MPKANAATTRTRAGAARLCKLKVERSGFQDGSDGWITVSMSLRDLLRATVAAGDDPELTKTAMHAREALAMRIAAVKSAVDCRRTYPRASGHFLESGSTDKAHRSHYVGNAICAHLALDQLDVPWLVDVERLPKRIELSRDKNTNQRPDFLGHCIRRNWHILESKGRSARPGGSEIQAWKNQAASVTAVNHKPVTNALVSVAFVGAQSRWDAIWNDPPTPDDAVNLLFDPFEFFQAYYNPIINALGTAVEKVNDAGFIYVADFRMSVGLHQDIRRAVSNGDSEAIVAFASGRTGELVKEIPDEQVYPDGIIVRRGRGGRTRPVLVPAMPAPQHQVGLPQQRKDVQMPAMSEKETQDRILRVLTRDLGYRYLGDWTDRAENSNVEEKLLASFLSGRGYSEQQISRAMYLLKVEAVNLSRSLYDNNQAVYRMLRYGVPVKVEAGKVTETVHLIDWEHPEGNDFAVAEEVTLRGNFERRPDLVLYVNGIALAVIELKKGAISIGDGIRQLISNQADQFNAWFFSTVQFVIAGNNSEGLRYGTVGTEEKYFLTWKEDEEDNTDYKLDKYLRKLCRKGRLIELMHDFILFDAGWKKVPRPHQFFGIKAAQQHVNAFKGGIIWHTQGSGKSIVMVLLAKWILENKPNARVLIVTDRDELDKQIEGVFGDAGEQIVRTNSGRDLLTLLGAPRPRLMCSLVHKFGRKDVDNFEQFIKELQGQACQTVGDLFVFVDECHRTQSGKLHRTMKAIMKNAVFIGFTGTPLLKTDRQTTLETFGSYIHTYKFNEAVEDEVVLDLIYEARDIDQHLGSPEKVDQWFEAKTKGLNDWQKSALREQWGTMQKVLSSRSRMERVVSDIVFDFGVKPRLSNNRGTGMLVASSIYEACKYYELFQKTAFKGKCGLITSYNPQASDVTLEDTGANTETDKQYIYNVYDELLKGIAPTPGTTRTETYEEKVKALFKKQPANMKLLIVVQKLLTGFDAPTCSYLYIDKEMQDHDLFQAICRTNRLDGDDKEFGYIVGYKNLFKKVTKAIGMYTVYESELDRSAGGADPEVLMKNRLEEGRKRLDIALEAMAMICEPVEPPKGDLQHIHYFCGNTEVAGDLKDREPQRVALYKGTAGVVRAYANIADELDAAGYAGPTSSGSRRT